MDGSWLNLDEFLIIDVKLFVDKNSLIDKKNY